MSQGSERTGYTYNPEERAHQSPGHPEGPHRLEAVRWTLAQDGLLERLRSVEATPAELRHIQAVHSERYVAQVQALAERGGGHLDPDTYVCAGSFDAALTAAGGVISLTDAVLAGRIRNGMALVRPPGHHARPAHGMGFCIFNNVAVAASFALQQHQLERVLILDFDVHHGNGTQEVFYNDPRVLFVSTHEYPFYPGSGHWSEIGVGEGEGFTVNIPVPHRTGDRGILRVYDEVIIPLAERYRPQLILVSAGYDAHWQDPLAMLNFSIEGYAEIVRRIVSLADALCEGRLVVVLEGGYQPEVLAHAVLTTLRILIDPQSPVSDPFGPAPTQDEPSLDDLIRQVREIHHLS